jgi:regulator of chromosome condensation (RCC1) repeat-containing protein
VTPMLSRFRRRLRGPAILCWTLAALVAALRPPAAAAVPAGVPLAWGRNDRGQLGSGTLTNSAVPIAVSNLANVVDINGAQGGGGHSLALRADGTVFAWGANDRGQLGNGTLIDSAVPVPVSNLTGVVAIGSGSAGTAVKSDGTVWTWGDNTYGQLGISSFGGYRTTPVRVNNLAGVVATTGSGGGSFNMALKADGTVWTWGRNSTGTLGDGTYTDRSTPARVINLPPIVKIAVNSGNGLALDAGGTVWAWGHNRAGELGNGTFTTSPPFGIAIPARVVGLSSIVDIADGFSAALKADGTVWTWGLNDQGQLGQGTITPDPPYGTSVPGQVVDLDSVVAVDRGSFAIKSDGTVWTWGQNDSGQLGIGIFSPYSTTPVQVLGEGGFGSLLAPITIGGGKNFHLAVQLATPYSWSGVLQPVNANGPSLSVFKRGTTVQLKFKLTGESAGITDAQARFGYAQIDSLNPGTVNESTFSAAATPGILFRYDGASGEYRYNWRTTGLGTGRYLLRIDLGDGVLRTVVVGLK